jgi:membrane dipeptidase
LRNTLRVVELPLAQIEKNNALIELARTASNIERINRASRMAAFVLWVVKSPLSRKISNLT